MEYYIYKTIHVAAVILFLGNITTGLFWMHIAVKTRDLTIITHTMKGIITADRYFTTPSVIIITLSGIMTAMIGHYPMHSTGWILWPITLFIISGAAFGMKVAPLQRKIHAFASSGATNETFDWKHFDRLYRSWDIWGAIALVTPLTAAVMMVLKIPQ